jgi:hypothetical protein
MTSAAHKPVECVIAAAAEPGWTREDFERLSEDEATYVLHRRMRNLLARGLEPLEALRRAAQLDQPLG